MESNEFDKAQEVLYNDSSEPITVDMRKQAPLNDAKCLHDFYEDAADPDSHWVRVYKCRSCPVGYLVER